MESIKFPKVIQIGIQDGYCNLKCKHCYLHSPDQGEKYKKHRGVMPLDRFEELVRQIKDFKPMVRIYRHSETLMTPDLEEYIKRLKRHDIPIIISTNGILLDDRMAQMIIRHKVDNVNFSIDAIRPKTFYELKGEDIEKSNQAVLKLLDCRGNGCDTRIGVSYVESKINQEETAEFIDYWSRLVDYVKIIEKIETDNSERTEVVKQTCDVVNSEMVIDHKGDVNLCMFDPMNEHNMGNVFKDGLLNVWNNTKFNEIRKNFIEGKNYLNDYCSKCKVPNEREPEEHVEGGVLIKRYTYATYYNNMERMDTYKLGRYQDKE